MIETTDAIYDGVVLRPDKPLELAPNTRVRLTVEALPPTDSKQLSFLRTARSLGLSGPADWSANLEK
jgi:hypothetical protein